MMISKRLIYLFSNYVLSSLNVIVVLQNIFIPYALLTYIPKIATNCFLICTQLHAAFLTKFGAIKYSKSLLHLCIINTNIKKKNYNFMKLKGNSS